MKILAWLFAVLFICLSSITLKADQEDPTDLSTESGYAVSDTENIVMEGNQSIPGLAIKQDANISESDFSSETSIQSALNRITTMYRNNGFLNAKATYELEPTDHGKVHKVKIDEGNKEFISSVNFVGNKNVPARQLRAIVSAKKTIKWLSFLNSSNKIDMEAAAGDGEKLRAFYNRKGFLDMRLVSQSIKLENNEYVITYTVNEGEKYSAKPAKISSEVEGLDIKGLKLERIFNTFPGVLQNIWENPIAEEIIARAKKRGIIAFDIEPTLIRDNEKRTASLDLRIVNAPPVAIAQINIVGNTKTIDQVIRREFTHAGIKEGIPVSPAEYRLALTRVNNELAALGYFSVIKIDTK